jgi:hypothetical protein
LVGHIVVALNGVPVNGYANGPSTSSDVAADFAVIEMSWKDQPPDLLPEPERAAPADSWPGPEQEFLDRERARLEAEIATAQQRAADATARVAARRAELRESLRAELSVARESLGQMQRHHDASIAAVRATEQRSVERILAEARQLPQVQDVD